jgi:hypothetical protein
MRGYLYVLTNEALPGLVKIGYSTKDPSLRRGELSNTSIPQNFVLYYEVLIDNPFDAEQAIHRQLKAINAHSGKEFFKITADAAVNCIRKFIDENSLEVYLEGSGKTNKCVNCKMWVFENKCTCANDINIVDLNDNPPSLLNVSAFVIPIKWERVDATILLVSVKAKPHILYHQFLGPVVLVSADSLLDEISILELRNKSIEDIPSTVNSIAIAEIHAAFFGPTTGKYGFPVDVSNVPGILYGKSNLKEYDVISLNGDISEMTLAHGPILNYPPTILVVYQSINMPNGISNTKRLKHLVLNNVNVKNRVSIFEWLQSANCLESLTYVDCPDTSHLDFHKHEALIGLAYLDLGSLDCEINENEILEHYVSLKNLKICVNGKWIKGEAPALPIENKSEKIIWAHSGNY